MDRQAVLAAFDEQIRRRPEPDGPGGHVERGDSVVRSVSGGDGWLGVTWSALDDAGADAAIAAQVSRFAELARPWEWKHYSYDQPPDLPAPDSRPILERLGFVALATTTPFIHPGAEH